MIEYRAGEATDSAAIAELMCRAGGGLMEFMLDGLVPHCSAVDLLQIAITEEASPYHYSNAVLAADGEQVVGLLLAYPATQFRMAEAIRSTLPPERQGWLDPLFDLELPESLYVNSVAVADGYGGRGIGVTLMAIADDLANAQDFESICLHIWADNAVGMRLYDRTGFKVGAEIDVKRHRLMPHDGGKYLLIRYLP